MPYMSVVKSAKVLDRQRLGKQRVEALQIAEVIIKDSNVVFAYDKKDGEIKPVAWRNHPCVKMWKPYLKYLLYIYIPAIMNEWESREYKNEKCSVKLWKLQKQNPLNGDLLSDDFESPHWLTEDFCKAHRSNLLRKKPEYYRDKFEEGLPDNLPYIWG
jgi:hypothetical protein